MLIKSMCWAVASVSICVLNIISRNAVFTFFLSFFILVIPAFMVNVFSKVHLGLIFCGANFSRTYTSDCSIILFIRISFIKLVILGFWGYRKYKKA